LCIALFFSGEIGCCAKATEAARESARKTIKLVFVLNPVSIIVCVKACE